MVKSPEAEARIFSAAGLKRTWPTFLRGRQAQVFVYSFLPRPVDVSCSVYVCVSLPRVPRQLAHGCDVCRLFSVGEESEILWHLPYENLAVVGTGGDNVVVEGVPSRSESTTSAQDIGHVPSLAG